MCDLLRRLEIRKIQISFFLDTVREYTTLYGTSTTPGEIGVSTYRTVQSVVAVRLVFSWALGGVEEPQPLQRLPQSFIAK